MLDPQIIADLAKKMSDAVPPQVKAVQTELEATFKSLLSAQLAKLDLVTREEFDAQVRVLARTREKLEALEKRLDELNERTEK